MVWMVLIVIFLFLSLAKYPLGIYIGHVLNGEKTFADPILKPIEQGIYRLARINAAIEMDWKQYAKAFVLFNLLGLIAIYFILRLQAILPLNPEGFSPVEPFLAFNTAISFATNTNWQNYSGENTLSYFSQMTGLTPQNFLSAASGIAVFAALARGLRRYETNLLGNFWVDITRVILYLLLPLSIIFGIFLVSQGVPQTLKNYPEAEMIQPISAETAKQKIAVGPVASQVAIKQLGSNGGGYFNTNSAHPFENPNPITNYLELIAILLIPVSLTVTYGYLVNDLKQGLALLIAMCMIFFPMFWICQHYETQISEKLKELGVEERGNLEGKEVRFGITSSALWATATTATSNGSVNAMHDSFNPISGIVLLGLMQIGEVVFGGVGCGIYVMIAYVLVAVFVAGLMVGRTPEYLGKKVESYEIKMGALILLIPIFLNLFGTAIAFVFLPDKAGALNPGPHAFSEVLYAFSSASANNGSAFAGLDGNNQFYNIALGIVMFLSRYLPAVCVVAMAGSMVEKKLVPVSVGSLPTHNPLFISWVVGVIIILGALSFLPALALGPIVEYLTYVN